MTKTQPSPSKHPPQHDQQHNKTSSHSSPHHNKSSHKSVGSNKSAPSIGSVGIGNGDLDHSLLYKLVPQGSSQIHSALYDCVVFVIYCPEHDKILLTNNARTKIVWLPFVILPEGVTWVQASQMGIDAIIGRKDAEMDSKLADKIRPHYKMSYLHIMRVQSIIEKFYIRVTQFVKLEKSEGFVCCRDMDFLHWTKAADVLHDKIENFWGPEVKLMTSLMVSNEPKLVQEFSLERSLHCLTKKNSSEQALLLGCKIKVEHVIEIYDDYISHCYPAHYMCYRAFKSFLVKYGFDKNDKRGQYLFNASQTSHNKSYINFDEFLVAIVCMEPYCDSKLEARIKFVFRYYNLDKGEHMDMTGFAALIQEIHPHMHKEDLENCTEKKAKEIGVNNNKIEYKNFKHAIESNYLDIGSVCRSQKPILPQISKLMSIRMHQRSEHWETLSKVTPHSSRCFKCQIPNYKYATHMVTIDTLGRCVQPTLVPEDDDKQETLEVEYSREYVFSTESIPNMLLDLITQFHLADDDHKLPALMCNKEDHHSLLRYVEQLCQLLNGILVNEKKLVRVNSPALVIGDLRGDLSSLIEIQRRCFASFPVLAENLIFLGNYHGERHHGVECLLFVFSLKALQPNKVFLLRGLNEVIVTEHSRFMEQCVKRYGDKTGSLIYQYLTQLFNQLPLACVVDETIACVHSGFPTKCTLDKLNELPHTINDIKQEAHFAYEILANYPKPKKKSKDSSSGEHSQKSFKEGDRLYHRHIFSKSSNSDCVSISSNSPKRSLLQRMLHWKSRKHSSSTSFGHSHSKLKLRPSLRHVGIHSKSAESARRLHGHSSKTLHGHSFNTLHGHSSKSLHRHSSRSLHGHSSETLHGHSSKSLHRHSSRSLHRHSSETLHGHSSKSLHRHSSRSLHGHSSRSLHGHSSKSLHGHSSKTLHGHSSKTLHGHSSKSLHGHSSKTLHGHSSKSLHGHSSSSTKHEHSSDNSHSHHSNSSSQSINLKYRRIEILKQKRTFDFKTFALFLKTHQLRFLIRSQSVCSYGYKLNFRGKCLTVFSSAGLVHSKDRAAVIQINGSTQKIRFLVLEHASPEDAS